MELIESQKGNPRRFNTFGAVLNLLALFGWYTKPEKKWPRPTSQQPDRRLEVPETNGKPRRNIVALWIT